MDMYVYSIDVYDIVKTSVFFAMYFNIEGCYSMIHNSSTSSHDLKCFLCHPFRAHPVRHLNS